MKILGLDKNLGLGRKFWVLVKILNFLVRACFGENFRFGGKFWFGVKILGFDENLVFLVKILGLGEIF